MKQTRKLLGVLLSAILALTLAAPALAAGEYTIIIDNVAEGHTYEAYQLFAGDLSTSGSEVILTNIIWGSGVAGDNLLTALKNDSTLGSQFASCVTAAQVAEVLGGEGFTADNAVAFAKIAGAHLTTAAGISTYAEGQYTISSLDAGYYLVKDQDESLTGTETYTDYIVRVADNVTVTPKAGTIITQKKVRDTNDSTGEVTDWQDSADYDIGDLVPFQISVTLPANYNTYESYELTIHDTESPGLTFQPDTVTVKVDGAELQTGYSVVTDGLQDECTFEIRFGDLKNVTEANDNSVITVEYQSQLNENAVIGQLGNPNEMYVTFSNNPNGTGTGQTPEDTVIVFTYKVVVNKVDGANQTPLAGAEFTLEKKNTQNQWDQVEVIGTLGTETSFSFEGLDDGDYRLSETRTPDGYNTMEPIEFTVTATHDIVSDSPALTELTGDVATGEITFASVVAEGSLTTTVENNKGSTLPTTGGMGTTALYALGGILVLGAGGTLIVKKQTDDKQEDGAE